MKKYKESGLEIVQMGHLTSQINALDEGNLMQVSTCQSDAYSLSKHKCNRFIPV